MKIHNLIALVLFIMAQYAAMAQLRLQEEPPLGYICYRASGPVAVDGKLDESDWKNVPWTEDFVDIEGSLQPLPHYRTRVKMLWDDDYFYIAAEMEEPHIWATFTERESVVFLENNFEVFIDPGGDTHNYYELEINALGTIWDLMLNKPYRNGGIPFSAWDVRGFKYGIHKQGTINNPYDVDSLWVVEMAFPWKVLAEAAPGKRRPHDGEQWRVNFSRVQWRLDIVDGAYQKSINTETGKPYPEYNWVWSPQWAINMHMPEYWGYVQFSDVKAGQSKVSFVRNPQEEIKYLLRELYYLQHSFFRQNNRFAQTLGELAPEKIHIFEPHNILFDAAQSRFRLSIAYDACTHWHISEDSYIWQTQSNPQN